MTDIPDWAFNRLGELSAQEAGIDGDPAHVQTQRAFARYIAEHEEPPVDPLLIEAREICAAQSEEEGGNVSWAREVRCGELDDCDEVICTLRGLKRGIELGKSQ